MKVKVVIYVTRRGVTEIAPLGKLVAVRHHLSHPDATIVIWRTHSARTAGRYDQIRHAVMIALQAAGASVSALRDHSNERAKPRRTSKRQNEAQSRMEKLL